jgi:hypothetical protein
VGAANNTLLYIDNIRLLKKNTNIDDGIDNLHHSSAKDAVYSIHGIRQQLSQETPHGIYIAGGKKIVHKN